MQKRGQAATEFLTTYGWAILILAGVIAAIFSLNLFNPKIENTCIGSDPVICDDVQLIYDSSANNYQVNLALTASGISTTSPTAVTDVKLNTPSSLCGCPSPALTNDNQVLVICNSWIPPDPLNKGDKFSGTATVSYSLPGSTSSYISKVIFSGTVEEGTVALPTTCPGT